jgi:hypothetical protein
VRSSRLPMATTIKSSLSPTHQRQASEVQQELFKSSSNVDPTIVSDVGTGTLESRKQVSYLSRSPSKNVLVATSPTPKSFPHKPIVQSHYVTEVPVKSHVNAELQRLLSGLYGQNSQFKDVLTLLDKAVTEPGFVADEPMTTSVPNARERPRVPLVNDLGGFSADPNIVNFHVFDENLPQKWPPEVHKIAAQGSREKDSDKLWWMRRSTPNPTTHHVEDINILKKPPLPQSPFIKGYIRSHLARYMNTDSQFNDILKALDEDTPTSEASVETLENTGIDPGTPHFGPG